MTLGSRDYYVFTNFFLHFSSIYWTNLHAGLGIELIGEIPVLATTRKDSWQHIAFLALFRGCVYPLMVLSVLQFELLQGNRALVQYGIGAVLLLTGIGLAFRITFSMGWRNAFGEKLGLHTTDWFAWSRNPVYVVTWIGLIGWAYSQTRS